VPNFGHDSPALKEKMDRNAVVLALVRIAAGFFFVAFGQYKVLGSGFAAFRVGWPGAIPRDQRTSSSTW
jgi:hypothetical protein